MTDTDKPTGRTPEPSHAVRAIRNSVLHAISERDGARAHVNRLAAIVKQCIEWHDCDDAQLCEWCENAAAAIKGIDTGGQARIVRG